MRMDPNHRPRKGFRQVFTMTVIHWRSKKIMRRKDGKPFVFWVPCK